MILSKPRFQVNSDLDNFPLKMADDLKVAAVILACATGPLQAIGIERRLCYSLFGRIHAD
jgi:hypothetical protein